MYKLTAQFSIQVLIHFHSTTSKCSLCLRDAAHLWKNLKLENVHDKDPFLNKYEHSILADILDA